VQALVPYRGQKAAWHRDHRRALGDPGGQRDLRHEAIGDDPSGSEIGELATYFAASRGATGASGEIMGVWRNGSTSVRDAPAAVG